MDVHVPLSKDGSLQRFSHYCEEKDAIVRKLNNSNVPAGKKERLNFRLKLLEEKLIPDTILAVQRLHQERPQEV